MNPDRVQPGLYRGFADGELGDGDGHRSFLAAILQRARVVEKQSRSLQSDLHVRNAVRYGLISSNRLSKLLPLLGIRDRAVQLTIHRSDERREKARTFPGHGLTKNGGPFTLVSEAIVNGNAAVVKVDGADGRAGESRLRERLANHKTRGGRLHGKCANSQMAVVRARRGVHDDGIGYRTIRNEVLRPRDHVVVPLANGSGLEREYVRTGFGFRNRVGADVIALAHPSEQPTLQRSRGVLSDRHDGGK